MRKEAAYEFLVHEGNRLTVHDVGGVEAAARDELDSNRRQEIFIDPADIDPVIGITRWRIDPVHFEPHGVGARRVQEKEGGITHTLDARDLGNPFLERVEIDLGLLVGIAIGLRIDLQNAGRGGSEARVDVP